MDRKHIGNSGEDQAADYLQKLKFKVIARNFHSRYGEIDIIAIEGKTLVFVEVKTRFSHKFGVPEEAVTPSKIRSIIRTGEYFKVLNPHTPGLMRIDVVAIDKMDNTIKLLRNVSQ